MCTAPDCLDQRFASGRLLGFPSLAGFVGCASAQLFEPPGAVVSAHELDQGRPEVGEGLVNPALQDLLLEGLPEPLDDAVGLRLPDISQALADAEVLQFPLKVIGDILAAVVVAQC